MDKHYFSSLFVTSYVKLQSTVNSSLNVSLKTLKDFSYFMAIFSKLPMYLAIPFKIRLKK